MNARETVRRLAARIDARDVIDPNQYANPAPRSRLVTARAFNT